MKLLFIFVYKYTAPMFFLYAKISQLDFTRRSSIDKFAAVKKERQRKDHLIMLSLFYRKE